MAKHVNGAFRLYKFFERLRQNGADQPVYRVWGQVLELPESDEVALRREIAKRVSILADQIELVQGKMRHLDYSEELYAGYLQNALRWASTLNVDAGWRGYHGNITGELILALRWCSEVLPHEEESLDGAEVTGWASRVEQLLGDLASSDLPTDLRQLLSKRLQELRDALRSYQLSGLVGIEDVLLQTEADMRRRIAQLRTSVETVSEDARRRVGEFEVIVKEVGKAVDRADHTRPDNTPCLPNDFSVFGHVVLSGA